MLWTGYEKDPALELMRVFLAAGASKIVNAKAGYLDETPLSHICQTYGVRSEQALECARLLIQYGADVNCTNKDGATPLQTLTVASWTPTPGECTDKFVGLLLDSGATWRHLEGKGRSPLERCIERGDWRSIVHFARHGATFTRHQRQEITTKAPADESKAIFEAQEAFLQKEKEMVKAMDQGMDKLLKELGEAPTSSQAAKKRGKKTARKSQTQRKAAQLLEQAAKAPTTKKKDEESSEDSDDDDDKEEGRKGDARIVLHSAGPLTVIAPATKEEDQDADEDEGDSQSAWLAVGKKISKEEKKKASAVPAKKQEPEKGKGKEQQQQQQKKKEEKEQQPKQPQAKLVAAKGKS
jgi:hypothetical protein